MEMHVEMSLHKRSQPAAACSIVFPEVGVMALIAIQIKSVVLSRSSYSLKTDLLSAWTLVTHFCTVRQEDFHVT